MEYRQLGMGDLSVSSYGLGVMTFGGQTDESDALRQMDRAHAAGITLFDTAENYPVPTGPATQGRSEEILGKWIAARGLRDKIFIATKVAGPGNAAGDMTHIRGANRRLDRTNIRSAVETSLRRLGTDYIDRYQVHWAERPITTLGRSRYALAPASTAQISIEETLSALGEMVTEGKVRAVGVCNETPWGVMRYLAAAERMDLPRISSVQNGYSLLDRSFELGLAEIAVSERVGLIAYSPLAGGTLTGTYGARPEPIPGSRSSQSESLLARFSPGKQRAILDYGRIALEWGLSPTHLALAFVQQQPFVTSALMAASSIEQLEANLGAIEVQLPAEAVRAVNAIHDPNPNPR